jgi:hypothetical protein
VRVGRIVRAMWNNEERSARLDALQSSLEDVRVIANANVEMIARIAQRLDELREELASEARDGGVV